MKRDEGRYGIQRYVKVGTMPGYSVWVRFPEGGLKVGTKLRFREDLRGPWTEAAVERIGPPPEERLFLSL